MKHILFVTNVNPFTASFGAEQRSYILLQSFLQNECRVDVAYLGMTQEDSTNCPSDVRIVYWHDGSTWQFSRKSNLMRLVTIRMYPVCPAQERIVDHLIKENNYDYIACRYISTASTAGLYKYANRLLLDVDDLPAPAMAAQMGSDRWYKELYHKRMIQSVANETKRWLKRSKACFIPDNNQAEKLHCTFLPNIPVTHLDNISFEKDCKNILFVGLMSFRPNYEGVDHFISQCWNNIIKAEPNAHLLIAGKGLSEVFKTKWGNYKNVEILGFVDDIIDFYDEGNIVVVPVYSGAGTNIKVIEALAVGKATILTPFSYKGYETILCNGINTFIANNDETFTQRVIELLQDNKLCQSVAVKGHQQAMKYYSQRSINQIISKFV